MGFTCTPVSSAQSADAPATAAEEASIVLLELFTSQGCSSCPPADALLAELADEATSGDLSVVALSYHVDYWNRLGWTDPYSQAAFSDRQRAYAQKLADQRVYTPQLVVQGKSGHVGSREREIRQAIRQAQLQSPATQISLQATSVDDQFLQLDYTLTGRTNDLLLHIAVADASVENDVPRGENRGRHLVHRQLVRQLYRVPAPDNTGSFSIDTSILADPEQGQVIVFAQDADNWEVLGVSVLQ